MKGRRAARAARMERFDRRLARAREGAKLPHGTFIAWDLTADTRPDDGISAGCTFLVNGDFCGKPAPYERITAYGGGTMGEPYCQGHFDADEAGRVVDLVIDGAASGPTEGGVKRD